MALEKDAGCTQQTLIINRKAKSLKVFASPVNFEIENCAPFRNVYEQTLVDGPLVIPIERK